MTAAQQQVPATETSAPSAARGATFATEGFVPSADGTRLHFYTVGEGSPAIVCCDGLGCDGYVWKYVAETFAPRHQVVRFHWRGHGQSQSPADRSRMRVQDLCDDLLAVLDAHKIEKAVLLGHSLGVQVILEFHRLHPDRVLSLVPVCGSYGKPLDTFRDVKVFRHVIPLVAKVVQRFPEQAKSFWKILDTELAFQVAIRTDVNGELVKREDFRPYLKHLSEMDPALFFSLAVDAGGHDALLHLQEIDVPTLIVAGEKDTFTPMWLSAVMHARIRDSELLTIPTGTHTAPIEMPELFTLRLRRFLDERVLPLVQGTQADGSR